MVSYFTPGPCIECQALRQVTDQAEQGNKVAGFYRLTALPAILIIEPATGAKLRHWTGFVEAHRCARLP